MALPYSLEDPCFPKGANKRRQLLWKAESCVRRLVNLLVVAFNFAAAALGDNLCALGGVDQFIEKRNSICSLRTAFPIRSVTSQPGAASRPSGRN